MKSEGEVPDLNSTIPHQETLPAEIIFAHLVARTSNKNGQHFYFSEGHADAFLKLQQYFLDYHIVHSSVNIIAVIMAFYLDSLTVPIYCHVKMNSKGGTTMRVRVLLHSTAVDPPHIELFLLSLG